MWPEQAFKGNLAWFLSLLLARRLPMEANTMASPPSRVRKFLHSLSGRPARSRSPSPLPTPSSSTSDSTSPATTNSSSAPSPAAIPRVDAPGSVFRVTSIPFGTTISDLHEALSLSDLPTVKLNLTSLCPSPDGRHLTALIHFASPPSALTSLKHGGVHPLKLGGTGRRICIDREFYGLTQLYPTPEGSPILADVIAVCGLNSHAYGSWASEVDSDGDRVMWLRHFLPEDVPGCRIMIYGYDSNLSPDTQGIHKISDYRDSFLEEVRNARRTEEEKERGLVFIGHSFGGIIIAQALVKAKESEFSHGTLFRRTLGTMFFGTPHRGFLVDDILAMVNGSTRAALVESLEEGSEELATELNRFITYAAGHGMRIVSFKETQQTRKLQKGTDGRWTRSGSPFTAVEAGSAILVLPETIETSLPATGNNSTMVKFKSQSEASYQSVINRLEDWIKAPRQTAAKAPQKPVTAYKAVKDGNAAGLDQALKHSRVKVNELLQGRTTLLHIAVENGDKDCIHTLLTHGAMIDTPDLDGKTPLHLAVQKGCDWIWAIEMLIEEGADIRAMCAAGFSVLHIAAKSGNEKMVACLLDQKANIETTTADGNSYTALHLAAKAGHVSVVELLLKHGANIRAAGEDGDTPLHSAAWEGQETIASVLLDNGADPSLISKNRCTPFHFAAYRGHLGIMKLLIRHGVNISATDISQRTALHVAAGEGRLEVTKFLIGINIDMSAISIYKHTALHTAAKYGRKDVVRFLLEQGADDTATDVYDNTPFDLSVAGGHEAVMEILSARKALTMG